MLQFLKTMNPHQDSANIFSAFKCHKLLAFNQSFRDVFFLINVMMYLITLYLALQMVNMQSGRMPHWREMVLGPTLPVMGQDMRVCGVMTK